MQTFYPQEKFMRRAFYLARLGKGNVSPNPMVGCVVVYRDKVIGEGFHHCYGQWHAEVHAINAVLQGNAGVNRLVRDTGKDPRQLLRESTLYVSLEPCSHYGKTPPCAQKIIEHHIPRVVVSCGDPNPEVNGQGVAMLRGAGVEVIEHFLEAEGREMGRRFFTNVEKKRPYVILKWARSADGNIAMKKGDPVPITGFTAQTLNHRYRVEEDAIMVGTGTLLADNPRLDARRYNGKQPVRISMDLQGRVLASLQSQPDTAHTSLHFFDGTLCSILFVSSESLEEYISLLTQSAYGWQRVAYEGSAVLFKHLHHMTGFKLIPLPDTLTADQQIELYLEYLHEERIGSLIVEGGTELLQSFIRCGIWDEARVFASPKILPGGYPGPRLPETAIRMENMILDSDMLHVYRNTGIDR